MKQYDPKDYEALNLRKYVPDDEHPFTYYELPPQPGPFDSAILMFAAGAALSIIAAVAVTLGHPALALLAGIGAVSSLVVAVLDAADAADKRRSER